VDLIAVMMSYLASWMLTILLELAVRENLKVNFKETLPFPVPDLTEDANVLVEIKTL
jgi:hypothetical protein